MLDYTLSLPVDRHRLTVKGVLMNEYGVANEYSDTDLIGTFGVSSCTGLFMYAFGKGIPTTAVVAHIGHTDEQSLRTASGVLLSALPYQKEAEGVGAVFFGSPSHKQRNQMIVDNLRSHLSEIKIYDLVDVGFEDALFDIKNRVLIPAQAPELEECGDNTDWRLKLAELHIQTDYRSAPAPLIRIFNDCPDRSSRPQPHQAKGFFHRAAKLLNTARSS